MSILNFTMLLGGLSFFLYGMKVLSTSLEKLAGSRLESALSKITDSTAKSLLFGAGVTIAIQSSSALTVMLVGLVNSGIMALSQTVKIIMGSNIGTTLTSWITSLSGINSDNMWLNLLKPENFSPVLSFVGIVMIMTSKSQKRKDTGSILIGFSVLMFGMKLMSDAMSPLKDIPQFKSVLTAFNNPMIGVIIGAVFTAVIQSSAASVAILQSLAITGSLTYGMAIPIILGQNIGTCITALVSGIGVSKDAKKVSVIHVTFNILGSAIFMAVFYTLNMFFRFAFISQSIDTMGIAVVHSVFNITTTVALLPFAGYLQKLADILVSDKHGTKPLSPLPDDRLMRVPSFAISKCTSATIDMAHMAKKNVRRAIDLLNRYDVKYEQEITDTEKTVDEYEDKLSTFIIKLSSSDLTEQESLQTTKLLYTIGDFERISDHTVNLVSTAKEMHAKKITLPTDIANDLTVVTKAVYKIVTITTRCFEKNDLQLAHKVEPLEQVIDLLIKNIRAKNTKRIQKGSQPYVLGFILSDLLTNYSRISDHCSNIAVAVIEIDNKSFGTHKYLNTIKSFDNPDFRHAFDEYMQTYRLM